MPIRSRGSGSENLIRKGHAMQTGRDAINHLIHKRPADHVPQADSPWGDALKKWVAQGMPANEKGEPEDAADQLRRRHYRLPSLESDR